eukprot:COSAG02_NODE_1293_length_13410_cov_13.392004_6_plen_368_part_00
MEARDTPPGDPDTMWCAIENNFWGPSSRPGDAGDPAVLDCNDSAGWSTMGTNSGGDADRFSILAAGGTSETDASEWLDGSESPWELDLPMSRRTAPSGGAAAPTLGGAAYWASSSGVPAPSLAWDASALALKSEAIDESNTANPRDPCGISVLSGRTAVGTDMVAVDPPVAARTTLQHAQQGRICQTLAARPPSSLPTAVTARCDHLITIEPSHHPTYGPSQSGPRTIHATNPAVGLAMNIGAADETITCPLCQRDCEGHHRLGFHWGKFGYGGPPYCSRCASVFRAHMIKRTVSVERCYRDGPCSTCTAVLSHFACTHQEAYARIDECASSRPRPQEEARGSQKEEMASCPYCAKSCERRSLGKFW